VWLKENHKRIVIVLLYLLIILFITFFSRVPQIVYDVKLVPFWSYASWLRGNHSAGRSILLNIVLFIPLGYFLSSLFSSSKKKELTSIAIAGVISLAIEILQMITCRGMCDIDDLISNITGAAAGVLLFQKVHSKRISAILLAAGCVGCLLTVFPSAKNVIEVSLTKEFDFEISSVTLQDNIITLDGYCYFYERKTPSYSIVLKGQDKTIETQTVVDGRHYTAVGSVDNAAEEYTIMVRFNGFAEIATGTYLNSDSGDIKYVRGQLPQIDGIPEEAILKAYSAEFDTAVYQYEDRLIWIISSDLDDSAEVIYHVYTSEPEKLPEARTLYGYDNLGFRVGNRTEMQPITGYKVFEKKIPSSYAVSAVVVGLNVDGTITWSESFRVK